MLKRIKSIPVYCLACLLGLFLPMRALWLHLRILASPPAPRNPADPHFDVICFSHVPWHYIWQRNHHTMTRLARHRKVIYIQSTSLAYMPEYLATQRLLRTQPVRKHANLTVITPVVYPGQARIPFVAALNRWLLSTEAKWLEQKHGLRNTVLWYYYPAAANVLESFTPSAVVYDIQDEYSAFAWAPRDIAQREQRLIDRAEIIFAGTHALYESKTRNFRGKAYFYPCAVEFGHFFSAAPFFSDAFFEANPDISPESRATIRRISSEFIASGSNYKTVSSDEELPLTSSQSYAQLQEPSLLAQIPHPRLTYVGLIDKRIDADLIIHIARAHPEWQIVMMGPVEARLFDQAAVERAAPNVHFLGTVPYPHLPSYLAHSEVYLMPWKVNELTLHINPTKTLEYMAAARPVVSISLPDLEKLFSDTVSLATTPAEFVAHCEAALAGQRWNEVARGLQRAWDLSWDSVVAEMEQHVSAAIISGENHHR